MRKLETQARGNKKTIMEVRDGIAACNMMNTEVTIMKRRV